MKRFLTIILLTLSLNIYSQSHLSIDINDPVYLLLETSEKRGVLNFLPLSKPYAKSYVIKLLNQINLHRDQFSQGELDVLDYYLAEFGENSKKNLLSWNSKGDGNIPGLDNFSVGTIVSGNYRSNLNNSKSPNIYNGFSMFFKGDIGSSASYFGQFGFSVDKISPDLFYNNISLWLYSQENDTHGNEYKYYISGGKVNFYSGDNNDFVYPGTYAPYQFDSSAWSGHHTLLSAGLIDGVSNEYSYGLNTKDEISVQLYDNNLSLRMGTIKREWGHGDGSLYLSGTSVPFEGIDFNIKPSKWFEYSFVVGSLGNWFVDTWIDNSVSNPEFFSEQKMISLQQFSLIYNWGSLSLGSSAIWGKRFELAYLSPLLMPFMSQEYNGDFDNVNIFGGAEVKVPYLGNIYLSIFLDETSLSKFSEIFTYARNMYAYQGGLQRSLALLPFGQLTLQYTKVNPFVYSHYAEGNYPQYNVPVSMTYTHGGQNLGYFIPPNSDEILLKYQGFPRPNLLFTGSYQLIRHGTNEVVYDEAGDPIAFGQIFGDIYIPFNYKEVDSYPLKDFLNDGIYDWSNIISLKAEYSLSNRPVKIGLEYIFSSTFWVLNGRDITVPDTIYQNILALTFSINK